MDHRSPTVALVGDEVPSGGDEVGLGILTRADARSECQRSETMHHMPAIEGRSWGRSRIEFMAKRVRYASVLQHRHGHERSLDDSSRARHAGIGQNGTSVEP